MNCNVSLLLQLFRDYLGLCQLSSFSFLLHSVSKVKCCHIQDRRSKKIMHFDLRWHPIITVNKSCLTYGML